MNDNWIYHDNPPRIEGPISKLDLALVRWSMFPLWVRIIDISISILLAGTAGWGFGALLIP